MNPKSWLTPGSTLMKFIFAFVLVLATAVPAWADRYYCLLFAYDSHPIAIPCKSHVWGTFVQVGDDGKLVKQVTISWEPDKVSYLDKRRPGCNSTDSLDYAIKHNRKVRMWGPFETEKITFTKAVIQDALPGKYKFIDCCWRSNAQNCIHRLSDVVGPHQTGVYWGWWAGESVYKHYQRHKVIRRVSDGESVMILLGISKYPIDRK